MTTKQKPKADESYTAASLKHVTGCAAVRAKPSMYIGPLGAEGKFTILREAADNVVDEALNGHCTECNITVKLDGSMSVYDNGRGIPTENMPVTDSVSNKTYQMPGLQAVTSLLHAGGKLDADSAAYKASRGCFTGDTKLRLLSGKVISFEKLYKRWTTNQTPIPIMSFNVKTQKLEPSNISHVQITKRTRNLVAVHIGGVRNSVICTPDHPFYVNRGGSTEKVKAEKLAQGDSLVTTYYKMDSDGYLKQTEQGALKHNNTVDGVTHIHKSVEVPVYDITVDTTHTFFVDLPIGLNSAPMRSGIKTTYDGYGVLVSNSHGLGVKCTNFLSTKFSATTTYNGKTHRVDYVKGQITEQGMYQVKNQGRGTLVEFRPDPLIFGTDKLPLNALSSWASMASYFTPGLKITVNIEKAGGYKTVEYYSENGIADYLEIRLKDLSADSLFKIKDDNGGDVPLVFELATPAMGCGFALTNYGYADMAGFTNGLANREGGEHVNAFFAAYDKAISPYKGKATFGLSELKEGVVGVINSVMSAPMFSSQDKVRLVDPRAKELVQPLTDAITKWFKAHPDVPKQIVARCAALQALKKKFSEDKNLIKDLREKQKLGLSIKVVRADNYPPDQRSLLICEGDSAAGGLRQCREPWQELLPLKGVPVNCYGRLKETKVLANNEIQSLLTMIGFDLKNPDAWTPRIGSALIISDNDDDGKHISALILAFFHRYAPRMLQSGMVRVVVTPEYVITSKGKTYFGENHAHALQLLTEHGGSMKHIKGLGEMDVPLLKQAAVDVATRKTLIVDSNPDLDVSGLVELIGESPEARKRLLGF